MIVCNYLLFTIYYIPIVYLTTAILVPTFGLLKFYLKIIKKTLFSKIFVNFLTFSTVQNSV